MREIIAKSVLSTNVGIQLRGKSSSPGVLLPQNTHRGVTLSGGRAFPPTRAFVKDVKIVETNSEELFKTNNLALLEMLKRTQIELNLSAKCAE